MRAKPNRTIKPPAQLPFASAAMPARARCWQALRILRSTTIERLAAVAEVSRPVAFQLCCALVNAGLAQRKPCGSYQLLVDLGTKAPTIRANGDVFDRNKQQLYPNQKNN